MGDKNTKHIIVEVPIDLHKKIKTYCLMNDTTIKEAITKLLKEKFDKKE